METILAKTAGFCYGVKRAVDIAVNESNRGERVFTLGNLIHNDEVIKDLASIGIACKSIDELKKEKKARVIIRSHGISKKLIEELEAMGHEIVDATCPFVKKIHTAVSKYSQEGYYIVILGDPQHAEIKGIIGWIDKENYTVINSKEQAEQFILNKTMPIALVAQTTFNNNKFKEYVEIINQKGYDVFALDTICSATYERQKETEEIASKVDAMIVIGDRNSSNSRKLFEIAKSKCKAFFIQTKTDINSEIYSIGTVGITAGASTPDNIIREVMLECQK